MMEGLLIIAIIVPIAVALLFYRSLSNWRYPFVNTHGIDQVVPTY